MSFLLPHAVTTITIVAKGGLSVLATTYFAIADHSVFLVEESRDLFVFKQQLVKW